MQQSANAARYLAPRTFQHIVLSPDSLVIALQLAKRHSIPEVRETQTLLMIKLQWQIKSKTKHQRSAPHPPPGQADQHNQLYFSKDTEEETETSSIQRPRYPSTFSRSSNEAQDFQRMVNPRPCAAFYSVERVGGGASDPPPSRSAPDELRASRKKNERVALNER